MLLGAVIAQMRVVSSTVLWTPLNMAAVPQIYLDAEESVVTNVSGFASAISNLGAMGANGDFSQGTAASRPAILAAELNGKQVLSFDGTDDLMLGATAAQKDLFRNVGAGWAFVIYKKRVEDVGTQLRYIFNASTTSATSVRFNALHGVGTGQLNKPAIRVRRLDADSIASLISPSAFFAVYTMVMYQINYAAGAGSVEVDGTVVAVNASLTSAGSTSNTASAASLSIGANDTGLAPADIDLAAIIVSNTQPSVSDINKLFGWAAHKYGLTANLPSGHPYKTIAPTVGGFDLSIGIEWTSRTTPADNDWRAVAWAQSLGLFAAIASTGTGNRVMTSPDGINWTIRTSAADNGWYAMCWSPELNLFVATAFTGTGNRVMTSPDGINWTIRTSAADNQWLGVAWGAGPGRFVAVSNTGSGNRVMSSTNGATWVAETSASDNDWNSVCWSPELSLFVAVASTGSGNRVMTSPTGVVWTSRTSAADIVWSSVCWSPELSLFVAVASSGTGNRVMTSSNGTTWTIGATPADNSWNSVCWSPERGLFVAIASTGTGSRVMTSPDGIVWTLRTSAADSTWRNVAWSPALSKFVATAGSGTGTRVMTSL